jgi:hypothetical protein
MAKERLDRTDPRRSIWRCPCCDAINVWSPWLCARLEDRSIQAVTCTGSCFDNICGACHSNIVKRDSPILAECFTHHDYSEADDE